MAPPLGLHTVKGNVMRYVLALLLLGTSAFAQQQPMVRPALWCDTQSQVVRVMKAENKDAEVDAINAETPSACGVSQIAFFLGEEVGRVVNGKTFRIVEIEVVAANVGSGWMQFPPMKQYSAFEAESEGA